MNFPKILGILTGIPGKPFKILQNSEIPQDSKSAGFGILHKLLLSFLEILKFLGIQFSVVNRGCVGIFWNSPLICPNLVSVDSLYLFTPIENNGSSSKF